MHWPRRKISAKWNLRRLSVNLLLLIPIAVVLYFCPVSSFIWIAFGVIISSGLGLILLAVAHDQPFSGYLELGGVAFVLGMPLAGLISALTAWILPDSMLVPITPIIVLIIAGCLCWNSLRHLLTTLRPGNDIWILLFIALAAIIVAGPFFHVGIETVNGTAYRAYFDHDFLVHLAVAGELTKGIVPPRNPYFSQKVLHYYWIPFQFPAMCFALSGNMAELERLNLASNYLAGMSFLVVLFWFFRNLTKSSAITFSTLFITVFLGSWEGFYWVIQQIYRHGSLALFRYQNIDGLTRWIFGAPQIDTLFRGLLFTPQHLIALGLLCIISFDFIIKTHLPERVPLHVITAAFLITGCSVFIGGAGLIWIGFLALMRIIRIRRLSIGYFIILSVSASLALILWFQLGMLTIQDSSLIFGLKAGSLLKYGWILALNFSFLPLWIFWSLKYKNRHALSFFGIFILSIFFIFCFSIPDYENEFGLRGGFLCYLACAGGLALLLSSVNPKRRWIMMILSWTLALPGAISLILDTYNLQDVTNKKFTLIIPRKEQTALDWLKKNTHEAAVVQRFPERFNDRRNAVEPNLIPPFAHRVMLTGRSYYAGQFQVGKKPAQEMVRRVTDLYHSPHQLDVLDLEHQFHVDYWWMDTESFSKGNSENNPFLDSLCTEPVFSESTYFICKSTLTNLPPLLRKYYSNGCQINPGFLLPSTGSKNPDWVMTREATLNVLSGFEKTPIQHNWIFDTEDPQSQKCLLGVRQTGLIMAEYPEKAIGLEFQGYYFSSADKSQKMIFQLNNEDPKVLEIQPGWHRYNLFFNRETESNNKLSMAMISELFLPGKIVCKTFDNTIGQTDRSIDKPLLVRTGPAPGNGFFADIFYDSQNLCPHKPGLNIALISPESGSRCFDLQLNNSSNAELIEWIQEQPDNQVFAGVSLNNAQAGLSEEGWKVLQTLGLQSDPRKQAYDGWAFIAFKGSPPNSALELFTYEKADFIYIGPNQGDQNISIAIRNPRWLLEH